MPAKIFVKVQLPPEQPDCCAICPLCGLIPKSLRKKGSKETHVCLGTFPMEALSGRGIRVRASKKDKKHPLHRPCDERWNAWMLLPQRKIAVKTVLFTQFRVPFEQSFQPEIKFHS